ncbi:NYN domain-containing protein [Hyphomonas sp.]|uniref:NYN domain-containing protein n=1 Tax=Hyphomonas sp. TaxID=87 RepID=UPI00391873F5
MARVRSVLLVDFDNVYGATSEDVVSSLSNWLLWLEDGAFSPGGKRRTFLHKRVYWNLQFDRFRPEFEEAGFEAFNCRALAKRKISAGKSSADIVITMDAIELALQTKKLEELIVLTTDSDFVPVVNRVQNPGLRVVTAGKETDPTYELYSQHADAVIHIAALKAGFSYQRTPRRWYQLRSPPPQIAPLTIQRERQSALMGRVRDALTASETPPRPGGPSPDLARAADIVKSLGERMPDQVLSKTKIVRALTVITGFTPTYQNGIRPWLGHKNFAALMRRLAQIYPEIEVRSLGKGKVEVIWRDGGSAQRSVSAGAEDAPREEARSPAGEEYEPAPRPITSPA